MRITMPFTWYRATPSEYVVKYVNGVKRAEGQGKIFFVGPRTTLAKVPATEFSVGYAFTERTSDGQEVVVNGEVVIRFDVHTVLARHDFSFDPRYAPEGSEEETVEGEVQHELQTYFRRAIRTKTLKEALGSAADLQEKIAGPITQNTASFTALGVQIRKLFVTSITPANLTLKQALEAEAREQMLTAADRATAERRREQATSDRDLKEYEAETAQKLEENRAKLVTARSANIIAEAEADAEAIRKKLAPYDKMDPRLLFAIQFPEIGRNGKIGQLNITPEFLAMFTGARPNGRE